MKAGMGKFHGLLLAMAFVCYGTGAVMAQVWETFDSAPQARWVYVSDGVMGGVSNGRVEISPGEGAVRLLGEVSTDNNGGFIQVRRRFDGGWPAQMTGLRLSVRGNGEIYYVFLRTRGLNRVWHSYRAEFAAGPDWSEVTLPLAAFAPSHGGMPSEFSPTSVISIGLVAYGREHEADLTVREISLY